MGMDDMISNRLARIFHPSSLRDGASGLYRSHRLRKIVLILAIVLVIFGLLGFFAAPPIIKGQIESRASTALDRPITLGAVHLNPYTLKFDVDQLHIGDRDGHSPFVDIDHLTVNAAWSSVLRMAPVLDALTVQHPQIHITRTSDQQFNFSDLIDRFASKPADPNAPPARFALSNISVHNGDIAFDDKVLNTTHNVSQIEIGIPFIANLPHDTDVFVQPLLAMQVDGSPIHIGGQTKPFAESHESAIDFNLDHLDLPRYLSYVPTPLPIAIPSGQLSGQLKLDFIDKSATDKNAAQQLKLTGNLQLDNFALSNHDNSPIVELGHVTATLADVEPLVSRYYFDTIALDRTTLHYTSLAGGRSNLDALTGAGKAPVKPTSPATDARIATLTLQGSQIDYADLSGPSPAKLSLDNVHGTIHGFATLAAPPTNIDLTSGLAGGTLHINGALHMTDSRFVGQAALTGVGLQPLVAMAPPMLNAQVSHGSLDASGQLIADWSKTFNMQLDMSKLAVNDFALQQHSSTPISWKALNADITHLDLASSQASLSSLTLQGLKVDAQRYRNGRIDLTDLVKSSPHHAASKKPAAPTWHWSIAHLGVDGSAFAYRDAAISGKTGHVTVSADKFAIDGLSDNMHQPLKLDLTGGIDKGKYHITGTVRPEPMNADLHVTATRLNVAPFESMVKVPLNVHTDSALLSLKGHVRYRDHKPEPLLSYQGQVTLGRVNVLDNVTGAEFLRWNSLAATGLNVRMGEGAPQIAIGGLALDDFYARVIINSTGRTNLQDVVASPEAAPVSVTQANNAPAATAAPKPAPAATTNPAPSGTAALATASSAAPPPVISIGQIILARGNLNYTDNFIQPNYTANITQLAGKIGAFGTAGGPPADLTLLGQLDDNTPINIDGTINPLTPVAFLDIKGKADGVELTHLSPYSSKYTGYPIIKGRLTMDVHYNLDQGKLNADNHILLNQLTFGDRAEGKGISHLPVKLAVALLKDSDGNIDIDVPVTGSLSDPHFSFGSVIWHAFVNLISRAVTSPFRLLASAMGGGAKDLGYVEFAPGSNVLDAEAQIRLTQIVKILDQKTALKLDITGRVDPSVDENGLRTVLVDNMVQKEEADDIGSEPAKAAPVKPGTDDYNKYLTKAYKHAKFKKPRDLVGLTKSQPPDVMTKLMEANVVVDQDALRHLAERRADAVRQFMHGKIDDGRVFVLAPKLDAKGIDDKGKTTRDDFGLH
ncbi:MAG: DUF748 domain-containing protein [Rhodanobacter sp.]